MKKAITYLEKGKNNRFTCVLYENVEQTNNFAEQTVRESVIVRKIIGAFRSEKGYKLCKDCIANCYMET